MDRHAIQMLSKHMQKEKKPFNTTTTFTAKRTDMKYEKHMEKNTTCFAQNSLIIFTTKNTCKSFTKPLKSSAIQNTLPKPNTRANYPQHCVGSNRIILMQFV